MLGWTSETFGSLWPRSGTLDNFTFKCFLASLSTVGPCLAFSCILGTFRPFRTTSGSLAAFMYTQIPSSNLAACGHFCVIFENFRHLQTLLSGTFVLGFWWFREFMGILWHFRLSFFILSGNVRPFWPLLSNVGRFLAFLCFWAILLLVSFLFVLLVL